MIVCLCFSEFSDIFDDQHFKMSLKDDVRVVSHLPVKYLRKRPLSPVIEASIIDEQWLRSHLMGPVSSIKINLENIYITDQLSFF